ncbi:unnamed protein product [Closterium sp. Naga37s-1]|nr:unnamed protein product [Closterium sp. Naga37s-1]
MRHPLFNTSPRPAEESHRGVRTSSAAILRFFLCPWQCTFQEMARREGALHVRIPAPGFFQRGAVGWIMCLLAPLFVSTSFNPHPSDRPYPASFGAVDTGSGGVILLHRHLLAPPRHRHVSAPYRITITIYIAPPHPSCSAPHNRSHSHQHFALHSFHSMIASSVNASSICFPPISHAAPPIRSNPLRSTISWVGVATRRESVTLGPDAFSIVHTRYGVSKKREDSTHLIHSILVVDRNAPRPQSTTAPGIPVPGPTPPTAAAPAAASGSAPTARRGPAAAAAATANARARETPAEPPELVCVFALPGTVHRFGANLSDAEKYWVVGELAYYLQSVRLHPAQQNV